METSFCSDSMFKKAIKRLKCDFTVNADKLIIAFCIVAILDLTFGSVCSSKLILGIPCPFCGLTRAGVALLSLDFKSAWEFNPLIYYISFLILLWLTERYLDLPIKKILFTLLIMLIVISIPLYIYRWRCFFPHTEPMTYRENNLLKILCDLIARITGG